MEEANLNLAVKIFITVFGLSAVAGLASLLRNNKHVSLLSTVAAMLNSGILGTIIAMLFYNQFKENLFNLIGLCMLSGLGGTTLLDFIIQALKGRGVNISIKPNDKDTAESVEKYTDKTDKKE